jgi:hypothetical protein
VSIGLLDIPDIIVYNETYQYKGVLSMRKKTMISLDEKDMDKLNNIARETHRSRSGMIGYLLSLIRLGKGGAVEIDEEGTGHEESGS